MKSLFLVLAPLTAILGIASAFASTTPEENRARVAALQANRTDTVWSCTKGSNSEAVVMFHIKNSASGMVSGNRPLVISDEQICSALSVTCPFVAGVPFERTDLAGDRKYAYWASQGRYEETVAFISEGNGMKLVAGSNGSPPSLHWDRTWFFNAGECELH